MARLIFKDSRTRGIYEARFQKCWSVDLQEAALRKFRMMEAARSLNDIGALPGNRLEALKGARQGQWSIRVNLQWRICFRWFEEEALDIELVDYHD